MDTPQNTDSVLDLVGLRGNGSKVSHDYQTEGGGSGSFEMSNKEFTLKHNQPIDGGKGGVVDATIVYKFPAPITKFFASLDKIKMPGLKTGDGKQMGLGQFIGEAYGRISMFGGGLVSGISGFIGGIQSGDTKSITMGVINTVTNIVGMALPGIGSILNTVVSFFSGLFGKPQKSPTQILSEQVTALHKAMMKGFNQVYKNQKLILENMATGFKNISRDIKLDGQLTRNAIAGVSDKIDRSTDIILDQIDSLRMELNDSVFGLQSSFNLNFGLLNMQIADATMALRKDLLNGFSSLQKNLNNQFSFLKADFNDFKFDNKLEFANLKLQLADIKGLNLDIKNSIGIELENVLKLREFDLLSANNFAIDKIKKLNINTTDIIERMKKETMNALDDLYARARLSVAQDITKIVMQGAETEINKAVQQVKDFTKEKLEFLKLGKNWKLYYIQVALNEQHRKQSLPEIAEDGLNFMEAQKALNEYKQKLDIGDKNNFRYLVA